MDIFLQWSDFKLKVIEKNRLRWVDREEFYLISYKDDIGLFESSINKDSGADQADFETNYKSFGNAAVQSTTDSDGSLLIRTKATSTGWGYQLHGVEFETSTLNCVFSKKPDNTDFNFCTIKYYELIAGVETQIVGENLNQNYLDSNCVKTEIDWEPTHDIELIGGMLKQKTVPASDLRLWAVGVPDVAEIYGGSKMFITNVNLSYIGLEDGIKVDGRAAKRLNYSATYHTSKMRLIFRHPVGFKHKMNMVFEIFKA